MTEDGLRARKRRQTHDRIANAAIELFLAHGFDDTTVDDIARAADVSKRSFFDYFATKEDVVGAWQDEFGATLAAAVAARPPTEAPTAVVEEALTLSIQVSLHPRSVAIDRLVRTTPSLRAREHMKYAKLEQTLADALLARVKGEAERLRVRLLAAVTIASLRVVSEERAPRPRADREETSNYLRATFGELWGVLEGLGTEGLRKGAPRTKPKQRPKKS